MAVPRISITWIFFILLLVVVGFFGYHIYVASQDPTAPSAKPSVMPYNDVRAVAHSEDLAYQSAPIRQVPTPLPMPEVAGQTEEDLRQTSPLNDTPPAVEYADPEPEDPLEGDVYTEAEFGDNLRHPEQAMEIAPPLGSIRAVEAGVGGNQSFSGMNESVPYTPELAQNGGEFMSGIMAFDGDGGGIGYAMI